MPRSTIEAGVHADRDDARSVLRRRRWLHRLTFTGLAVLLGLAVADGFDLVDAYGVDDRVVRVDTPDGTLVVQYPAVTRPALASPFRFRVEQPGGFEAGVPVVVAVSRPWIEMWDENGLYPSPSAETGDGDWVIWEFDPPADGGVLEVFYDARIEPARQQGQSGELELRDDAGVVLAHVDLRTEVRP